MDFKNRQKLIYPLGIFSLVLLLLYLNFTPGTYLTGWDNTHPEFDFLLNLKRNLYSVWREHRGVGLLGGLSHATQLPMQFVWFLSSIILPTNVIRYFWQFLMLFIGGLGAYFFTKDKVFKGKPNSREYFLSFLASLFYMFNLSTLHAFYVPLETFTTHFGFLPWLFLFSFKYVDSKNLRYLLYFSILSFIGSVQSFTATLFFAYALFILLGMTFYSWLRHKSNFIKPVFNFSLVFTFINLFWLLPLLYFIFTKADMTAAATINLLSSEESFLINQKVSDPQSVSLLKGPLFVTTDLNLSSRSYEYILLPWMSHMQSPWVSMAGYFLFTISLVGILAITIFKYLNIKLDKASLKVGIVFSALFFLGIFVLLGDNSPFGFVFNFARENIPILKEALRFPYTKFSIIFSFVLSVLFTYGISFIINLLDKFKFKYINQYFAIFVLILIFVWFWPAFKGNFIYTRMRNTIPKEYFSAFEYLDTQPADLRVLNAPFQTHWSWRFNDWGYRGSGFKWFGIKQPTIDRAFDVWSDKNEGAYRELSYSFYSRNFELFESLFEKYNIGFVFVDKSIFEANVSKNSIFLGTDDLIEYLDESSSFSLAFEEGSIKIYKYLPSSLTDSFVYKVQNPISVEPDYKWDSNDLIFEQNKDYYSKEKADLYFPFISLNNSLDTNIEFQKINNKLTLISQSDSDGEINFYSDYVTSEKVLYEFNVLNNKLVITPLLPEVRVAGERVEYEVNSTVVDIPEDFLLGHLYVGDKYIGSINSVAESTFGNALINPSELAQIKIVELEPENVSNITDLFKGSPLDVCESEEGEFYEVEFMEKGFKLNSMGSTACIAAKLPEPLQPGFYTVELSSNSVNAVATYCIYEPGKTIGCINKTESANLVLVENEEQNAVFQIYSKPLPSLFDINSHTTFSNVSLNKHNVLFSAELDIKPIVKVLPKRVSLDDKISVLMPIISGDKSKIVEDFNEYDLVKSVHDCNFNYIKKGDSRVKLDKSKGVVSVSTKNESLCLHFYGEEIEHGIGYLLSVEGRSLSGHDQSFCFQNNLTGRCDLVYDFITTDNKWATKHYFIPPMFDEGKGVNLRIKNESIGNKIVTNQYSSVEVNPFFYNFLKSIYIKDNELVEVSRSSDRTIVSYESSKPYIYNLKDSTFEKGELLVLSQGYDKAWVAFCGYKLCAAEHVLVNNWSNGWEFNNNYNGSIKIVFLGQYLQTLGYFALVLTIVVLIKKSKKDT